MNYGFYLFSHLKQYYKKIVTLYDRKYFLICIYIFKSFIFSFHLRNMDHKIKWYRRSFPNSNLIGIYLKEVFLLRISNCKRAT